MNEATQKAQEELEIIAPKDGEIVEVPKSIEDVIAGLKGWGIEELEEIITFKSNGKTLRLKISNIPTSDEMLSIQAAEEYKAYAWIKKVKAEIVSRSISWIDGVDIRSLTPDKRWVADPTSPDKTVRDIQEVLRNLILSWGQESLEILWKIVMTHAQSIENRLSSEFPNNMVMNEIENRLFEQARKQVEEQAKTIMDEAVSVLYDKDKDEE